MKLNNLKMNSKSVILKNYRMKFDWVQKRKVDQGLKHRKKRFRIGN